MEGPASRQRAALAAVQDCRMVASHGPPPPPPSALTGSRPRPQFSRPSRFATTAVSARCGGSRSVPASQCPEEVREFHSQQRPDQEACSSNAAFETCAKRVLTDAEVSKAAGLVSAIAAKPKGAALHMCCQHSTPPVVRSWPRCLCAGPQHQLQSQSLEVEHYNSYSSFAASREDVRTALAAADACLAAILARHEDANGAATSRLVAELESRGYKVKVWSAQSFDREDRVSGSAACAVGHSG